MYEVLLVLLDELNEVYILAYLQLILKTCETVKRVLSERIYKF